MNKILVTGSLFVLPEHEQTLQAAGFAVERLYTAAASEEELISAVRGKVGYILGGNEQITRKVIDAADALKVIAHCGTDYKYFVPAWRHALQKDIAITNVPDGHGQAVAEWAQAAALAMNRSLFEQNSGTTRGIEDQTIGIVGLGHIGSRLAGMLRANCPKAIRYYSTNRHPDLEASFGLHFTDMKRLLRSSDIVFLCVPSSAGKNFFGLQEFRHMRPDALLVSMVAPGVIDSDALCAALRSRRIRAASDYPMDSRFDDLPPAIWHSSSASRAFNTATGIRQTSGKAVNTLLEALANSRRKPATTMSRLPSRPSFAILGSGIIGMAVGNTLLNTYPNARVTIYTNNVQNIVTNAAGAQFYPIWLGDNLPPDYDTLLRQWFLTSKAQFIAHQKQGKAIHNIRNYELFTKKTAPPTYFYDVLDNLEVGPDPKLPKPYTYRYVFDTMVINPLLYLPQITADFVAKGGRLVHQHIHHLDDVLRLQEPVVFNCLGMGAKTIFGDPHLQAVKGVSLRLLPIPALHSAVSTGDLIVAPRGNETYVGASYLTEWDTLEPTAREQAYILDGVAALVEVPGSEFALPKGTLRKAHIIQAHSGLRPLRAIGPRVEKEQIGGKTIVHNYGHGGNGIILSWGTAAQAMRLVTSS